nr:MAG TPA: hypothetical protein [Caudoviricetes sp.]
MHQATPVGAFFTASRVPMPYTPFSIDVLFKSPENRSL